MEVNHRELLENLMHELARISSIIKSSSEAISKAMKGSIDKQLLTHHSEMILENSFLFSTHLDVVNYQLNPDFFEIEKPDKRNIFGKFHKAILSYRRIAKQNNIDITVEGNVKTLIDAYPVIDTLPLLIIDNAVKYSPKNCEIEVDFFEDDTTIEASVQNTGPYLAPEERLKLFERGYRGKEVLKTDIPGHGYGMNFIKYICDIHQADVDVKCGESTFIKDGIKYADFKVTIYFPKRIIRN